MNLTQSCKTIHISAQDSQKTIQDLEDYWNIVCPRLILLWTLGDGYVYQERVPGHQEHQLNRFCKLKKINKVLNRSASAFVQQYLWDILPRGKFKKLNLSSKKLELFLLLSLIILKIW